MPCLEFLRVADSVVLSHPLCALIPSALARWRSCPTAAAPPPLRQDPLQAPHGDCQAAQVSSLLQELRQHILPGPAPPHPLGGQALHLPLLPEGLPPALPPAAAHTVRARGGWGPGPGPPALPACTCGARAPSMRGAGGECGRLHPQKEVTHQSGRSGGCAGDTDHVRAEVGTCCPWGSLVLHRGGHRERAIEREALAVGDPSLASRGLH